MKKNILLFIFSILCVKEINNCFVVYFEHKEIKTSKTFNVEATCYNAVASQCDSRPLETASGFTIDTKNIYKKRIVAISRDLRKSLKMGDVIYVHSKNSFIRGKWYVEDVMNKRFKKRIDFLVLPKHNKYIGKIDSIVISKIIK